MEAYKFETVIQEEGIINLPELKKLANHRVEIIIVDVSGNGASEKKFKTYEEFSKKWKGCLKGTDISDYKEDRIKHIEEKHR